MLTSAPSYSFVSSPRYQTFPPVSCAYQSNVSSTISPSSVTVSRTTVAWMPSIIFVWSVTVTTMRCSTPSSSTSRYTHLDPGVIGQ